MKCGTEIKVERAKLSVYRFLHIQAGERGVKVGYIRTNLLRNSHKITLPLSTISSYFIFSCFLCYTDIQVIIINVINVLVIFSLSLLLLLCFVIVVVTSVFITHLRFYHYHYFIFHPHYS